MVADFMQEIERLRLGQLLGFADAPSEGFPRHDRFDRLERVGAPG
jgi:hypothetical protein